MKGDCSWNSKSGETGFGLPWTPAETLQAALALCHLVSREEWVRDAVFASLGAFARRGWALVEKV